MKRLILIAVLLLVGAGCTSTQPKKTIEPTANVSKGSMSNTGPETADSKCFKTYRQDKVSFEYPCDWETNIKGKNNWSAVGTVVAPDSKASFHYPAPDFGLEGMNLVQEGMVKINGNDYSTKKFEGNGVTITFVEMGKALNENGYNLMFAHEGSEYPEAFDHILATLKF